MIEESKVLELLDKSTLFRGIPRKELAPVFTQAMMISLEQGERLLSPGIKNEHVYIILSGQLSVHLSLSNLYEPLAILNPGECVGEMSVLVDSDVSAFVIANTACQLMAIGYSSFWSLIKGSNESARNMLNILVQRIRMGNEVIADALLHHDRDPVRKTSIDSMTGLYNNHGMQENFDRAMYFSASGKQSLCLVLLEMDEVGNRPGGELGDEQPVHAIAGMILPFLRPHDYAGYLNGNQFAILLPKILFSDAFSTAEQLRATVGRQPVRLPDGRSIPPVTVSGGICKANADDNWGALLTGARQALGRAIRGGRNRISD